MTDQQPSSPHAPYDPASMATSSLMSVKAVWYKRPWFMITVAVVVVIAVSVISDLPHPLTKAQDASVQDATIREINLDAKPCIYALKESFRFYENDLAGKLSAANMKTVSTYLSSDRTACSFASSPIYNLTNNIEPVLTTAGLHIDHMLRTVMTWTTSDALAAIIDIQYLIDHPGDSSKIKSLSAREALLAEGYQSIQNDFTAAEAALGLTLRTAPNIPVLAHLTGT